MQNNISEMQKLINSFSKLPTVGNKMATRLAYSIINMPEQVVLEFANNLISVKKNIKLCGVCGNWTTNDICDICKTRKSNIICVVKEPKDIFSFEKIQNYSGTYHVLGGTISPLQNRGPNDLNIKSLLNRINNGDVEEVILATNPDVEGEATSMYLASLLKPLKVKVTRLAQGISMGSELEYTDEITLSRAFEERKTL